MVKDNLEVKTVNCGYFNGKPLQILIIYKEAIFSRTHYCAGHKHNHVHFFAWPGSEDTEVWKIPPRIQGVEPDSFIQILLQQTCDKFVGAFKEYVSMFHYIGIT